MEVAGWPGQWIELSDQHNIQLLHSEECGTSGLRLIPTLFGIFNSNLDGEMQRASQQIGRRLKL